MKFRFDDQTSALLEGAIDFHIHSTPDVYPRLLNDVELAISAKENGMRAILIKNHYFETASRARVASEVTEFDVFGGIGGRGLVFSPPAPDSGPYTLYSGCEVGLCRSRDGANTWEQVAGAPRPSSNSLFNTALVANSDSQRTRLYLGTPGGVVTSEGLASTARTEIIESSALEYSVLGGGVYRLTSILYSDHVYMPLVER